MKKLTEDLAMPRDAYIHTRIDPDIKELAEQVLTKIGLSMTDAVSLFLTQVTLYHGLPFPLTIPPDDREYQENRDHLLEAQKAKLNSMIQAAREEVRVGSALTPDEARARTRKHLQKLRNQAKGLRESI